MGSILRIRDKNGNIVDVLALQGAPGKDGHTPEITIVDGIWYIDGQSTGVTAVGTEGSQGPTGPAGSDASVTKANIQSALGYVPADAAVVGQIAEEIGDIDTALDAIIAMQNKYIGGEGA